MIFKQNDPSGSAVARLVDAALARLQTAGLEVLVLPVPGWEGIKGIADRLAAVG